MRCFTLAAVLALLVLVAPSAEARGGVASSGELVVAAAEGKQSAVGKRKPAKAKRKRCRKGYVLRTVRVKRKGKTVRVKRCRKKHATQRKRATAPTQPAPASGSPSTPPADDAARRAIAAKLADTRFSNCAEGWNLVSCFLETRYSHFADGRFAYCKLTPGAPRPNDTVYSTFEIQNARTEPDGSWSFDSVVANHGTYRWRVGANGQVTGTVQLAGEDVATTLFTLQQLPGPRDCSR